MSRAPLVAANWKMHKTRAEAGAFLAALRCRARRARRRRGRRLPAVHRARGGGRALRGTRRRGRGPEHARGGDGRVHRRGLGADARRRWAPTG